MVKSLNGFDSVIDELNSHSSQLGLKANQTDLNATNANVSANTASLADILNKTNLVTVNKIYMDGSKTLRQILDGITDSSILNTYEVYIPSGTYDIGSYYTSTELSASGFYGLRVPDYVTLIGEGTRENTILQMTFSTANQFVSTLDLGGTSGLKNLTVIGNYTRYAVHDDFSYTDTYAYRNVENCMIQANNCYYNSAYGAGVRSGSIWRFKDTTFTSNTGSSAFSCHTNTSFIIPADLEFENCHFVTPNNQSIKLSSLASGVTNHAKFKGCTFNGILMSEETAGSGVPYDWNIKGFGNTKGLYSVSLSSGNTAMYNFSDEVPTMIAGETIAKGKPVSRNGYYIANQSTRDITRFFGVSMSASTVNNNIPVKTNGYVNLSDTVLSGQSLGNGTFIGIVNGDFAVVTSGKYIGVVDIPGYFKLIGGVATI